MSSFVCDKCGKECKDKRGLTVHSHKCGIEKRFVCEFCNQEFATAYSLSIHVPRCKTLKSQKELTAKEEMATLQLDLQAAKEEIHKLLSIQQEIKEESINVQNKLITTESQSQKEIKDLQEKHKKDLSELKTSLQNDLERQLRLRDNDLSVLIKDHTKLEKDYEVLKGKYEMLEEEKKSLIVDKQTLTEMNGRLSLKDNNTTIINQNDNRIQLNCLDSSMIQGRIHPPDYVIGNVNDFMRLLRSLGIRNCFRVNDKSRGTLSWHKPGEGEVRDPTGDQMLTHIIDILTPDITQEKCYYEEELKRQYRSDDPDIYQMNVYKTFVNFCSGLLQKDPNLLRQIKRELIKQGKAKNDSEVDPICEVSYNRFITSISIALFPTMSTWINKSLYDLGRFLGPKINSYYHTEGASRELLYIVVHSDGNYNHQIHSEKLMELLTEALDSIIETDVVERIIEDLVLFNKSLNNEHINHMINFLKSPSLDDTKEIMRGIVSL